MDDIRLKIFLTDLVYSFTVHSFIIFWGGVGMLLLGVVGLELTGASSNILTEVSGYMIFSAISLEVIQGVFNKVVWKSFI
ncbi:MULTISPECIES: hypothetical protein [Klebsiella]|uniref:hypothetical protein n=1 Tax=Klebsiella TaxID=570 RepID=UPI0007D0C768|nr:MULTISPECIES: hypothetical protein [Klebsiella]SBN08787.1 hypothetical protein KVMX100_121327 [Klebsiella variicola]